MDRPKLDSEFLDELIDGDREFAVELFETYYESSEAAVEEVRAILQGDDHSDLFRPYHTLKGASASVGLAGVEGLAKVLEEKARAGEVDYCRQHQARLEETLSRARGGLKAYLDSLS